jgi:hypothetical protein
MLPLLADTYKSLQGFARNDNKWTRQFKINRIKNGIW